MEKCRNVRYAPKNLRSSNFKSSSNSVKERAMAIKFSKYTRTELLVQDHKESKKFNLPTNATFSHGRSHM